MEWKLKGNEVGREYNWNLNGMEYKCKKKKKKKDKFFGQDILTWKSFRHGIFGKVYFRLDIF